VVVIQRVRIRWSAASRGAAAANVRRGIPDALPLPTLPDAPIVLHDVLVDEGTAYAPTTAVVTDAAARRAGLWIEVVGDEVRVDRLPGAVGGYPRWHGPDLLFVLQPGEVARYRANFRFAGGCCSDQWHYEQWSVHVAHAAPTAELFLQARHTHDIDHRVHLYG
jgi:hypothetical protein